MLGHLGIGDDRALGFSDTDTLCMCFRQHGLPRWVIKLRKLGLFGCFSLFDGRSSLCAGFAEYGCRLFDACGCSSLMRRAMR
jgi:hypothetical protein